MSEVTIFNIPENVQIGDVFERTGGGYSHMVFIGKVTPENVQTFLDLGIDKNRPEHLNGYDIAENPLVFIVFDTIEEKLYIENVSHSFKRVGQKLVNFKYSHNQGKVEKIVEKMKNESKKMKMEVGKVYQLESWRNGVVICLEYAPDRNFKHLEKFSGIRKITDVNKQPYMCLIYDYIEDHTNIISFFSDDFHSSQRQSIVKETNFDFQTMYSPWREIVLDILNKKDEVKKCFRINKDDRSVHCFEGRRKVKWAKENDKRQLFTITGGDEDFEKQWPVLNIDFPTYLLLTGLREKSKEDELLEIKEKLLSLESLGCQTVELTPIVEEFISLLHKINNYQKGFQLSHKNQVLSVIGDVLKIMRSAKDAPTDNHFVVSKKLIMDYAKKLVE